MAGHGNDGQIAYRNDQYKYSERLAAAVISAGDGRHSDSAQYRFYHLRPVYGAVDRQTVYGRHHTGHQRNTFHVITIYVICRIKPESGPPTPKVEFKEKVASLGLIWPVVVLFIVVIGGIYGGLFTPTEAGAIGSLGAMIIAGFMRRIKLKDIVVAFRDTAQTTAMIMIMIAGSMIFNRFITVSKLPVAMGEYVANLEASNQPSLSASLFSI